LNTERETTFVSDDTKRIAIVDTCNLATSVEVTIRYQYDNHLGSACLELDSSAQVISYEEYHPFGTTSYRAGRNATETSLKRYKYVGKERDEETGLYYYGARYYAAWLCRFVSVDPLQFKYPHYTPFQYAGNKPISFIDLDGLEEALLFDPSHSIIQINAANENENIRIVKALSLLKISNPNGFKEIENSNVPIIIEFKELNSQEVYEALKPSAPGTISYSNGQSMNVLSH
jgi:RHS repeat-associated protein